MILVDTSIWIELLNGRLAVRLSDDDFTRFVTCGPVVQQVFQGLREGELTDGFRGAFLAIPLLSDPLPLEAYLEAAEIYRQGHRRGYTIRSSADCLIAAVAIRNKVPIWHKNRDFATIARYTGLEAFERL